MAISLLVFDSHPVQYRVPIYQEMEKLQPGSIHVVYGSDCSVRGFADAEFGITLAWDVPMLEGYPNTILNCEKGTPLSGWNSLTGQGVQQLIKTLKPTAILLTGFNFRFDWVAYLAARKNRIPIWLRCETQDHALHRSKLKSAFRSIVYKTAYLALNRIFYIGELNKRHYLKHRVKALRLRPARYGTEDKFLNIIEEDKQNMRLKGRITAGISPSNFVIGFSGKLINKKNPDIIYTMLEYLPEALRSNVHIYFMGSGELHDKLTLMAEKAYQQYGIKTSFTGFVNQSQLAMNYLAMDVMVLPSRKMGETWGLVANEAMQAGCGVIVSDAVGCSADFANWERFRVFKEGDPLALATQVFSLSNYYRDFNWAKKKLEPYTIHATAKSLLIELRQAKQYTTSN
jgi:glycosyltransferase involved in cell wall biosynthesis